MTTFKKPWNNNEEFNDDVGSSTPEMKNTNGEPQLQNNESQNKNNVNGLSDFDKYLQKDLRIPRRNLELTPEAQDALDHLRDRAYVWSQVFLASNRYIARKTKPVFNFPLTFFGLGIALPVATLLVTSHRAANNPHHHRLPSTLPGVAVAIQAPTKVDWETVNQTQMFNNMNWSQARVTHFGNDGVFLEVTADVRLQKESQFVATVAQRETTGVIEQEAKKRAQNAILPLVTNPENQSVSQSELLTDRLTRLNQRAPAKTKMGGVQQKTQELDLLVRRAAAQTRFISGPQYLATKTLSPLVKVRKYTFKKLVQSPIVQVPTFAVSRVNYVKRVVVRHIIQERQTTTPFEPVSKASVFTPLHHLSADKLHPIRHTRTSWHKNALSNPKNPQTILMRQRDLKAKKFIRQTVRLNNGSVPSPFVLARKNQHLFYDAHTLKTVSASARQSIAAHPRKINPQMPMEARFHWQTYFHAMDLMPLKLEGTVFPNQARETTFDFMSTERQAGLQVAKEFGRQREVKAALVAALTNTKQPPQLADVKHHLVEGSGYYNEDGTFIWKPEPYAGENPYKLQVRANFEALQVAFHEDFRARRFTQKIQQIQKVEAALHKKAMTALKKVKRKDETKRRPLYQFDKIDGLVKEIVLENEAILDMQRALMHSSKPTASFKKNSLREKDETLTKETRKKMRRAFIWDYNLTKRLINRHARRYKQAQIRQQRQEIRAARKAGREERRLQRKLAIVGPVKLQARADHFDPTQPKNNAWGPPYNNVLPSTLVPTYKSVPLANQTTAKITPLFELSPPVLDITAKKLAKMRRYCLPTASPLPYQMPKTKIDRLTHNIQFQLGQTFASSLMYRQNARYTVYNSLFGFKRLMGHQLNRVPKNHDFSIPPFSAPHHPLRTTLPLSERKPLVLKDLDDRFLYTLLIKESEFFDVDTSFRNQGLDFSKEGYEPQIKDVYLNMEASNDARRNDKADVGEKRRHAAQFQADKEEAELYRFKKKRKPDPSLHMQDNATELDERAVFHSFAPNIDRFVFNARQKHCVKTLVYNNHLIIPLLQKNLWSDVHTQLINLKAGDAYHSYYQRFFLENANTIRPSVYLDDLVSGNKIENKVFENSAIGLKTLNTIAPVAFSKNVTLPSTIQSAENQGLETTVATSNERTSVSPDAFSLAEESTNVQKSYQTLFVKPAFDSFHDLMKKDNLVAHELIHCFVEEPTKSVAYPQKDNHPFKASPFSLASHIKSPYYWGAKQYNLPTFPSPENKRIFKAQPTRMVSSQPFTLQVVKDELSNFQKGVNVYKREVRLNKPFSSVKGQTGSQQRFTNQTKESIRHRVVQGHSPFLQRQMSGYANPDASFRDKYAEMLSWENLYQDARCVRAMRRTSGLPIPYSNNSIHRSLYFVTNASPQYHLAAAQELLTLDAKKPFSFHAWQGPAFLGSPYYRSNKTNFGGFTRSNVGLPVKEDKETLEKRQPDDVVDIGPNKVGPITLDLEKLEADLAKPKHDYIYTPTLAGETPDHGVATLKEIVGKSHNTYQRSGPYNVSSELWYKEKAQPMIPKEPNQGLMGRDELFEFSVAQLQKPRSFVTPPSVYRDQENFVDTSVVRTRWAPDAWIRKDVFGSSGTLMLDMPLNHPTYIVFLILLWYVMTKLNHLDKNHRQNIIIGLKNFTTKLDTESLYSMFKSNRAVVRCDTVDFKGIVGGSRILHLLYPLIVSTQAQSNHYHRLPLFSFDLLNQMASPSARLRRSGKKLKIERDWTEKELNLFSEMARGYAASIERKQNSFLLVGPPGTGKTYLVKAMAGECGVPVILPSRYELVYHQSENVIIESFTDEVLRLRQLFELAETHRPSILFLDEVDSLGPDRKDVQTETHGRGHIGSNLVREPSELVLSKTFGSWTGPSLQPLDVFNFDKNSNTSRQIFNPVHALATAPPFNDTNKKSEKDGLSQEALGTLTQLLCSLDGVHSNDVLVIAATNRPNSLDPALVRPGRLSNILYVDLPSQKKRVDLLKFYSRSRASESIDWEYFGRKTTGLSPAHLSAAMNLSALHTSHSIIRDKKSKKGKPTLHSMASIEYGIDSLTEARGFLQGFITRSSQRMNDTLNPQFARSIYQIRSWNHVSLACITNPIVLPPCELSGISVHEKLPTKLQTAVWQKLPEGIPRSTFPLVFTSDVDRFVYQPVGNQSHQRVVKRELPPEISDKKRAQVRDEFYQRHRASLRQAYLLSDPNSIDYDALPVTREDHPLVNGFFNSPYLDAESAETLSLFQQYVQTTFKAHMFGSKLLLKSTYYVDNPLCFATEYIYKKEAGTVMRSSAQFTRFSLQLSSVLLSQTGGTTLPGSVDTRDKGYNVNGQLHPTLFIMEKTLNQTLDTMFTNTLSLHRCLAYNVYKAIMVHLLKDTKDQQHMYDLWSRFKYDYDPKKHQKIFVKMVKENFVTRQQFEQYLLALSAGKVGEHLMLYYREALPMWDPMNRTAGRYTYDVSDIGREELKQMSWLLSIMVEKNLFYGSNVDLTKQALIPENKGRSSSTIDHTIVSVAMNKERWQAFDQHTNRLRNKFDKNIVTKALASVLIPKHCTYWWEPKGMLLPAPAYFNTINEWTELFSVHNPMPSQRVPLELHYDTYRPNVLRSKSLLDQPFDAKYLPREFVEAVTKQGFNWNQTSQLTSERIARGLLLDAFAKSSYVLIAQRELADYLSYYLLRRGKVRSNVLNQMCEDFLKPTTQYREYDLAKEKAITESLATSNKPVSDPSSTDSGSDTVSE